MKSTLPGTAAADSFSPDPAPNLSANSWLLTLAYLGTGFCGWQRQENGLGVARVLEEALSKIFNTAITAHGASRTDAGVHAEGQRVRIDLPKRIPGAELQRALNSLLPAAVRVLALSPCAADFNPRRLARVKHYRYQLVNGPALSPFLAATHHWLRRPLNVEAMRRGAARFLGQHDFTAFRHALGAKQQPHRTILYSEILQPAPGLIHYRVASPGFMHQQIRIMTGTLLEIGLGRRPEESVSVLLASGDRAAAGLTAPPHGLVLEAIDYAGPPG